jgi:hypothetical protein
MPQIKLDILEVKHVEEFAGRSLDVHVVDRVRGPVILRMNEDEARWLFASLADKVKVWKRTDDLLD